MQLAGRFMITRLFVSDTGNQYIDCVDLDDGSQCRFSVPQAAGAISQDVLLVPVTIQARASMRRGKTGTYVVLTEFHIGGVK